MAFLYVSGPLLAQEAVETALQETAFEGAAYGFGAVRAIGHDAPETYRGGGFGRLDLGESDEELDGTLDLQLGLEAFRVGPRMRWGGFVHLRAAAESAEGDRGDALGVVEAYAEATASLPHSSRLRLRVGAFLPPTSREATDALWATPYTLSFSALNTWIAEEVRWMGLSAEGIVPVGAIDELRLGGAVLGGADASGSLLAWRGWSIGDRLVGIGEWVPLPALEELGPGGGFASQRREGTRPFGDDLDGRAGWGAWTGWDRPERASIRVARFDNRGDRRLYRGEYAWRTRYTQVGATLRTGSVDWAAEWMEGSTGMGFRPFTKVQLDFAAAYLLASWQRGAWRLSGRADGFETDDRDNLPSELVIRNTEDGRSGTLALFWESPARPLRLGIEWQEIRAERPDVPVLAEEATSVVRLEVRWFFDRAF